MCSSDLYCTADYDEYGELMMDDGNGWALVMRKDDRIYPILEPTYIQLGQLEYKVYMEYGDEETIMHVLVSKVQGAGMEMYDCYYDSEGDYFVLENVYETTGNIGFIKSYK